MNRGDIVLGRFPHGAYTEPKDRPVLVVQSDSHNTRIRNIIVAAITNNLARRNDPQHLLIDVSTTDGAATSLSHTSLISCLNLAVLPAHQLGPRLGRLNPEQISQVNSCLAVALGLP